MIRKMVVRKDFLSPCSRCGRPYRLLSITSSVIAGVKANPFAEDWYVELIQSLCAEYGLKCHGRSELYTKMET